MFQFGFQGSLPVGSDLILIKKLAEGTVVNRTKGEMLFGRSRERGVAGTTTCVASVATGVLSCRVKSEKMRVMQRGTQVQ